jgi:hypothetical protein
MPVNGTRGNGGLRQTPPPMTLTAASADAPVLRATMAKVARRLLPVDAAGQV